jgi:hypothetical protein
MFMAAPAYGGEFVQAPALDKVATDEWLGIKAMVPNNNGVWICSYRRLIARQQREYRVGFTASTLWVIKVRTFEENKHEEEAFAYLKKNCVESRIFRERKAAWESRKADGRERGEWQEKELWPEYIGCNGMLHKHGDFSHRTFGNPNSWIAMPLHQGMNLEAFFNNIDKIYTRRFAWMVIHDVGRAILDFEKIGLAHGDIRATNIMLIRVNLPFPRVVLIDFRKATFTGDLTDAVHKDIIGWCQMIVDIDNMVDIVPKGTDDFPTDALPPRIRDYYLIGYSAPNMRKDLGQARRSFRGHIPLCSFTRIQTSEKDIRRSSRPLYMHRRPGDEDNAEGVWEYYVHEIGQGLKLSRDGGDLVPWNPPQIHGQFSNYCLQLLHQLPNNSKLVTATEIWQALVRGGLAG